MPATARPTHSHSHAGGQAGTKPKLYNPRHPERTLLYQTIAEHFETWHELASAGQFDGQGDHHSPRPYVRQAFRKYLECGIFAHGFARAWCDDCGHDYFVAYSCKGRGVCPSCNTRRMVETAAHLCDHVFPRLPVRQWVLSVPKRLRYFMQRDGAVLNMVLRIFLRVISQSLQTHSPGAANVDKAAKHIGAVAFIHRFGSSLNAHVHFHVCVVDGVFEEIPVAVVGQTDVQSSPPGIVFHPASAIDETAVAQVQTDLRRRILRAFVGRGLIEKADAKEMLAYQHSGFSVDAGVCIEADDRAALERLLRYCARPPFAMERLRKEGAALVYRCAKQRSEPTSDKRGAKVDELHLTALELIEDHALRQHGVGHLHEAGHVGAVDVAHAAVGALAVLQAGGVDALHDLVQARIDLVSRVQDRRMAFWLISRPEVATPPALLALPGAYSTPLPRTALAASMVEGMLAPSATHSTPFCDERLGVVRVQLVLRGAGQGHVHRHMPRRTPGSKRAPTRWRSRSRGRSGGSSRPSGWPASPG
jgi:hypothetical protein